jgi:hypothetical protein
MRLYHPSVKRIRITKQTFRQIWLDTIGRAAIIPVPFYWIFDLEDHASAKAAGGNCGLVRDGVSGASSAFVKQEMRVMRKRISGLLLALALLLGPAKVQAQDVPPVIFTGPFSHPRYESGGFFVGLQGLYWITNNPIGSQTVAVRGFLDVDGAITGVAGTFVGSGAEALNTNQLHGPQSWQPGFNLNLGYRFESGVALTLSWFHLVDARYSATASLVPPGLQAGPNAENSFLFSPVFNFPVNYAGNPFNLVVGNPGSTYGIWNAASLMTIGYVQRFDLVDLSMRVPIWETDCYRNYGLVGPRGATLYDKFSWRTVDTDQNGLSNNGTIADYWNITSNRLYGGVVGMGNEWFLGDTPIGAFSIAVDLEASLFLDMVKGRAAYELGDRSTIASRSRNLASLTPGLDGKIDLMWFPWEAVQFKIGYDFFAFFNTYASPDPIDFNYGAINPTWSPVSRIYHGVTFSVSFVF